MIHGLGSNPFLSGGLALGLIAAIITLAKRYGEMAAKHLWRAVVSEVDIREADAVMWFGLWLSHTGYGTRCKLLQVLVTRQRDEDEPRLNFQPGLGSHFFRHEGRIVMVERHRNDEEKEMADTREWYRLRVVGPRSAAVAIVEASERFGSRYLASRKCAYLSDGQGWWTRIGVGAPRQLSSIVLPDGMVGGIVSDIQRFLASQEWYVKRGIPWRRGFLFEGPPRTGKTSLARAISYEMDLPLYMLDLTSKDFSDRQLHITMSRLPTRAILMIEDIDEQLGSPGSLVTLSGLLNALDGALATEGRILIVTTNAKERLDAALLGEGRLDVHVHFGYATREQIAGMYLQFFPGQIEEAKRFADAVPAGVLPPASIQEHLVARCDDPERVLSEAPLLARKEVRVVDRERAA